MRYAWIAAHAGEYGVRRMCRVLGVQRSGYYAWQGRAPSQRAQADQVLVETIGQEYRISRKTYGSPRIYQALHGKGWSCGRHRVARLMRQARLVARSKPRKRPVTTQRQAGLVPAPNRLNQQFACSAPNQKWVSDFTYIATAQGWLYLAVVLDLYSRRMIGWAMGPTMDTALVLSALQMALLDRQPPAGLLHHPDQGSQYTSDAYLACLQEAACLLSMSRVGNCYDNAVVESFFSTLKFECVTGIFASQTQARTTIFEYLEVWYNRQRLHSSLGYCSPAAFEQKLTL